MCSYQSRKNGRNFGWITIRVKLFCNSSDRRGRPRVIAVDANDWHWRYGCVSEFHTKTCGPVRYVGEEQVASRSELCGLAIAFA
jgi:hypothetical protein